MKRLLSAVGLAALAVVALAGPASAHPLGNYTVSRAVAVGIGAERVTVQYVIDMAEIPAFSEITAIDANGDGSPSAAESGAYAGRACEEVRAALELQLGPTPATLGMAARPQLTLPPGASGLRTLRLICTLDAALPDGESSLAITDRTDDGHVGWREITIAAGPGIELTGSDVPSRSESALLTSYPSDRLESPPDVRNARAEFHLDSRADSAPATGGSSARLAPTAGDPLGGLVAGQLSPGVILVALLIAAGLGGGHALSPGHGKTLVAAYLVGSRGTVHQAIALGLTVAITHTAGVLVLGALVMVAGELFLPERTIGWLTLVSGAVMALLGATLLWRAISARRSGARHDHPHVHPHPNVHPHPHGSPHPHGHPHAPGADRPALSVRSVALLGMAGGLVPSASALIVLLAAVTTGRLLFGLGLIAAFGVGMAVVLGGIAMATTLAQGWLTARMAGHKGMRRFGAAALPVAAGMVVLGIGLGIAITAAGQLG